MTLVYHVYPKDQWCDPKEGTQPFVSKADFDDEVNLWKSNHKFASNLADDLTQDGIKERARIAALEARCRELEAALRKIAKIEDQTGSCNPGSAIAKRVLTASETCAECGGSGLSMQPTMPDGEPGGLPCKTCRKQFAPIGNGTICSNCTKTVAYHYQTAEGWLFCEVPTLNRRAE